MTSLIDRFRVRRDIDSSEAPAFPGPAASDAGDVPARLRLATIPDPNMAVGAAARFMMDHPAFALRPFGEWVHVIDAQARRGHQMFVFDADNRLVGFFGYALTSEAVASAWAAGTYNPSYDDCLAGDCIIFNAWIAENRRVLKFILSACRVIGRDKKAAYFKRYYNGGPVRAVRLVVNKAVASHVARAEARRANSSEIVGMRSEGETKR